MCACVVEPSSFGSHFHPENVHGFGQLPSQLGKRKFSCAGDAYTTNSQSAPLSKLARQLSGISSIKTSPVTGVAHGVKSERGGRTYMEDMFRVVPDLLQLPVGQVNFYSVYDGHGGDYVAKYCSDTLHLRLKAELQSMGADTVLDGDTFEAALSAAFRRTDEELWRSGKANLVGSTAVVVLITETNYFIASCGDSRAVLCRSGKTVPLTVDHSPDREDEQSRIKEHGGCVVNRNGIHRVMGALAVSRAIGDHVLRQYGVTYQPDTSCLARTANDDFLLLASDGLFSVLSNEEAVELARRSLEKAHSRGANKDAAARITADVLTRIALHRGAQDNVTVLIVDLSAKA